jgi:hypothetical protein
MPTEERIGTVDNVSVAVSEATRSGDPFAYAGAKLEEHPHGCIEGVVYIGHMVHDLWTGEEVEIVETVRCRRCGS